MTPLVPNAEIELFALAMEATIGVLQPERTIEDNTRIREQNRANLADNKKQGRYYSYALKALDSACSAISSASQGDKHAAIFRYSAHIGNHVAAGMIGESECYSALVSAGLATGYRQNEVERTVNDALRAGMSKPTDTRELDRKWAQKLADWRKQQANQINATYQAQKQELNESLAGDLFKQAIDMINNERLVHRQELNTAYATGNYQSWFGCEKIPLSFISAFLNLTETRNAMVLVFGKMDTAFKRGQLNPSEFTIGAITRVTGLDRRMVKSAVDVMLEFNLVQFPEYSSYKESTQESVHNSQRGRKAQRYCICNDRAIYEQIPERLFTSLELYFTEKYCRHTVAPLSTELQRQYGILDNPELRDKAQMLSDIALMQDKLSAQAKRQLERELYGDNAGWKGWEKALLNMFAFEIDWDSCKTIKDVRAQILKFWVKMRPQNSQAELCRVIGCSSATLSTIYHEYGIGTTKQYEEIELDAKEIGKNLNEVIYQFQHEHRGVIQLIRFKRTYGKWYETKRGGEALHFAMNRNGNPNGNEYEKQPIEKVYMRVFCPSVQHIMTQEEIEARDKLLAEKAQKEGKEVKPKTDVQRVVIKPSREWRMHDTTFLYQQIRVLTHCFTNFELNGNSIINRKGDSIYSSRNLDEIARFVLTTIEMESLPTAKATGTPKPLRTTASLRPTHQQNDIDEFDEQLREYFDDCRADEIHELELLVKANADKERQEAIERAYLELRARVDAIVVPDF